MLDASSAEKCSTTSAPSSRHGVSVSILVELQCIPGTWPEPRIQNTTLKVSVVYNARTPPS